MKYSVIWLKAAEQELAGIWLSATNRNAITFASNQIEQRLRSNPENEGESRANDQRITFEPPLAVLFKVVPVDCQVLVVHIWPYEI